LRKAPKERFSRLLLSHQLAERNRLLPVHAHHIEGIDAEKPCQEFYLPKRIAGGLFRVLDLSNTRPSTAKQIGQSLL
jgi:hypothetical protein